MWTSLSCKTTYFLKTLYFLRHGCHSCCVSPTIILASSDPDIWDSCACTYMRELIKANGRRICIDRSSFSIHIASSEPYRNRSRLTHKTGFPSRSITTALGGQAIRDHAEESSVPTVRERPGTRILLERSVCPQDLSRDGAQNPLVFFCEIANMLPVDIHDGITIRLLESHEDVEHLKLPIRAIRPFVNGPL